MGNLERSQSQTDLELEYIRKQMQQSSLGGHSLEAKQAVKNKIEIQNQEWLKTFHQRADEGYKLLLKEVFQRAQDGVISVNDEIESTTPDEYQMKNEGVEISKNPQKLQEFLKEGGTLQKLYGFSINVMLTFYDVSKNILYDKRNNDAINSFTFLCNLNPNITSFWISLGLAFEADQKWNEAIESYQIAIAAGPSDFSSYFSLIRCCGLIKDYSSAKEILESASENESIKDKVKDALDYIKSKEEPK